MAKVEIIFLCCLSLLVTSDGEAARVSLSGAAFAVATEHQAREKSKNV
jgi:hypothetical protein